MKLRDEGLLQGEDSLHPHQHEGLFSPIGILDYFKLGVPCTIMVCTEWWAYQVMTIFSGKIGVPEQAAQITLTSITGILFMIAVGL